MYSTDTIRHKNNFMLKPVLRPEYGMLFKYQSFMMQAPCGMYLFKALDQTKKMNLLLDLPPCPIMIIWVEVCNEHAF